MSSEAPTTTAPQRVLVPDGAIAWVCSTESYAGYWVDGEGEVSDALANGWTVLRAGEPDEHKMSWIEGVTGYPSVRDFMELASEVRQLRTTVWKLSGTVENLGALLSVAGESLRPEWRQRSAELVSSYSAE